MRTIVTNYLHQELEDLVGSYDYDHIQESLKNHSHFTRTYQN